MGVRALSRTDLMGMVLVSFLCSCRGAQEARFDIFGILLLEQILADFEPG